MITKLTTVVCIVAAAVLSIVATASPVTPKQRRDVATRKGNPTHFAGVPAAGVKPSRPTTGRLLLGLRPANNTIWNVYADGRVIWQKWTSSGDATVVPDGKSRLDTGYVQQRLTLQGVQLLRAMILSTGLFDHDLRLELGRGHAWVFHRVWTGDRMVTVNGVPSADPKATPAQMRALAWIEKLVADPARWLPRGAWTNRQIRAFVPARYLVAFDRGYPDIAKLPAPAGKVLVRYKQLRRHKCQILTTGQARAILQAFVAAGISPSENHAWNIGFDFAGLGLPHPSYLHLHPALPDDRC